MPYNIRNAFLTVTVSELGAELCSIQDKKGTEYLWQGDPQYWEKRSPILFPFIGRLTQNSYKYAGKTFPMTIHGFAKNSVFSVVKRCTDCVALELTASPATLEQYPFNFRLQITYALLDNALQVTFKVENQDTKTMYFGIGGHPGFNVPINKDEQFEDYELEFSCNCQPDRIGFSPAVYLNGCDKVYPLREERFIDLNHELFDDDAIILRNMAREVTLRSKISGNGLVVSYPDMPYLGIWHWPKTDAPYVCIEPWSSLPARQDVVEELSCKSDLLQLQPHSFYRTQYSIALLSGEFNAPEKGNNA